MRSISFLAVLCLVVACVLATNTALCQDPTEKSASDKILSKEKSQEAPAQLEEAPDKRLSLPSTAQQTETLKIIHELYAKDYANAKLAAEKIALSKKFLQQGVSTTDDPSARYMLFLQARDLALSANDLEASWVATLAIVSSYAVDPIEKKIETLTKLAKTATSRSAHGTIATKALELVEQAADAERYEAAMQVARLAHTQAGKARDRKLLTKIVALGKEVLKVQKEFEKVKTSKTQIEKNPTDPKANEIIGRYYCLTKGRWDKGLPMLILGGDQALAEAAKRDLAAPTTVGDRVKVADSWWVLSNKYEGFAKKHLEMRAAGWYKLALPALSGFTKSRVDKRLSQIKTVVKSPRSSHLQKASLSFKPSEAPRELNLGRFKSYVEARHAFSFSPDSQILAVLHDEGVMFWDLVSGKQRKAMTVPKELYDSTHCLAYSPDGKKFVLGGRAGGDYERRKHSLTTIWDISRGDIQKSFKWISGHSREVSGVKFSPDGKILATLGVVNPDNRRIGIKLWDPVKRKLLGTIADEQAKRWSQMVFSPGGKLLATGGRDEKMVMLWDLAAGKKFAEFSLRRGPNQIVFSPDGKILATIPSYDKMILWDVKAKTRRAEIETRVVAFAPNSTWYAIGDREGTVELHNLTNGNLIAKLTGHKRYLTSISVSPDGKLLATASSDRTVKLWDIASKTEKGSLPGQNDSISYMTFSPSGQILLTAFRREAKIWNVEKILAKPADE